MDSSVAVATVAAKPGTSHHLHQHHRATTIASYNNDEPSASSIIVTGDTHCTTMPATAPTPSLHLNFDTDAALEKLKEMSQLADNADNSSSNNNHTPNKDAIIDNVASGDTPLDISFSNNLKQIAETLKGAATTGIRFKKAPQFSESDSGSGEEEKQQRMDIPISVDAIENDQVNQATGVVFSKVSSIFDGGEVLAYCSSKVVGVSVTMVILYSSQISFP